MAIISQETWDNMPEEEKRKICKNYEELSPLTNEGTAVKIEYEQLFGKENLQPKPKIRTWEDVEKYNLVNPLIVRESAGYAEDACGEKIGNKVEATLKIAKLIELGYGGMVTEEEWNREMNGDGGFYTIKWCHLYHSPHINYETNFKCFIAFHSSKQAEEFMSYPENRTLVEQYYMI